jgi:hypothetical protein
MVEKPVQMAGTATEPVSELIDGEPEDLGDGKLLEDLGDVFHGIAQTDALGLGLLELAGEDGGHDTEQLATVFEFELGIHILEQAMAFQGQRGGGGVMSKAFEAIAEIVQQTHVLGRKQRQKMLEGEGEVIEPQVATRVGADFIKGSQVGDQNILVGERLRAALGNTTAGTFPRKEEKQPFAFHIPFFS